MLKEKFQKKPLWYYAFSICATWAGIGSLMNGVTMTQTYGAIPAAIWVAGNIFACILFGMVAVKIPKVREVFQTKPMLWLMGLMCVFQSWLAMNGMQTVFKDTILGETTGTIIAYALSTLFLIILFSRGMIRNVLTDGVGWVIVYLLAVGVTIAAVINTKGQFNEIALGTDAANMKTGIWKAILLLPGPFTYPYFFEILSYNDANGDGTVKINVKRAFTLGGILFGIYMLVVFPLAWTKFNPVLNVIKAVLITLIGTSTLSSAMFSIYIAYGRKIGLAINAGLIIGWYWLIPLGVMGMWTFMANVRIYIVAGAIVAAYIWNWHERRKRDI